MIQKKIKLESGAMDMIAKIEKGKENYVLSQVTSSKFLGSVGRQTFFMEKSIKFL